MQVYIGIDRSENKHDVLFMNDAAATLLTPTIPHTVEGFAKFDATRRRSGFDVEECLVALETAHNLLIDFLWARGYTQVYVVPPSVTKSQRKRYRRSGAYTDTDDAYLLADLLRTDKHRLQPWQPDIPLTQEMRAKVSSHLHLTRMKVRLTNRLRAILLRYYPEALDVFSKLSYAVTLEFIRAFPTPKAASALTIDQFQSFARQHHHSHPRKLPAKFARLQAPQPKAAPEVVHIYQQEAVMLATLLSPIVQARKETEKALKELFAHHPDHDIFASLPGVGALLGPGLLVKFGDDWNCFPAAASVQGLAGTCPVTKRCGRRKTVHLRFTCDREFRYIATQWARHSK